jgi:hypothetical protein
MEIFLEKQASYVKEYQEAWDCQAREQRQNQGIGNREWEWGSGAGGRE